MQTKLTLRLNSRLINRAKEYASHHGTSVSKLVEKFFAALDQNLEATDENDLPPVSRSLYGLLQGITADESDYFEYLEEKHR